MAFDTDGAKKFMVGVVLIIVALIFVVRLLPYAWKYIQEGSSEVNYTIADVPGGGLLQGFIIFILVLMLGIALVLKVFDLV